jgi:GDPmannose 4,6-dehydratase
MKTALITGVSGQDGSYLAEFLLDLGYEVHGTIKPSVRPSLENLDHLMTISSKVNFHLHECDLSDGGRITSLFNQLRPTEVYNLGAQSHVGTSFASPEYTCDINAMGCLRILEAIRQSKDPSLIRFYQASTSELFGAVDEVPQHERTKFWPRSPYAVAKLFAYWMTVNYREAHGIFACNGILFNHESPRRAPSFVTRKITSGLAMIALGRLDKLRLGNLDARRDWGHARDYVEMQWRMLQHNKALDFVISSGVNYSVREFVLTSIECLGMEASFVGSGTDEVGTIVSVPPTLENSGFKLGQTFLEVDPALFRPAEVPNLLGDASLAQRELGWRPRTSFRELVREMLLADLASLGASNPLDYLR